MINVKSFWTGMATTATTVVITSFFKKKKKPRAKNGINIKSIYFLSYKIYTCKVKNFPFVDLLFSGGKRKLSDMILKNCTKQTNISYLLNNTHDYEQ